MNIKITDCRYKPAKFRVDKKGKRINSGFILQIKTAKGWQTICAELGENALVDYSGMFSALVAKVKLAELYEIAGLEVPPAVAKAATDAATELENIAAKKLAKDRATVKAGKSAFLKSENGKAEKRWDKLVERVESADADPDATTETDADASAA